MLKFDWCQNLHHSVLTGFLQTKCMKVGPEILSQPKISQHIPNIMGEQRCGLDPNIHCLCCGLHGVPVTLPREYFFPRFGWSSMLIPTINLDRLFSLTMTLSVW